MKTLLLSLTFLSMLATASTNGWDLKLRGVYSPKPKVNYGFTVYVNHKEQAALVWDDGTKGIRAFYNPTPRPQPRCRCDVYENGSRRITVEQDPQTGEHIGVHYEKR